MSLVFGAATSDRVDLAAGLDNQNTFTVLAWHYPTTRTNGKRLWSKNPDSVNRKNSYWSFNSVGLAFEVSRATTLAAAESSVTHTLSTWYFSAETFDTTDGPRIFTGTLSAEATEDSYFSRAVGAGAVDDDSGRNFRIGQSGQTAPAEAYQGRIAMWAHYQQRMSLAEIISYQYKTRNNPNCDALFNLGENGTGVQPNRGSLGNGINGTVTGCSVGDHVPLGMING